MKRAWLTSYISHSMPGDALWSWGLQCCFQLDMHCLFTLTRPLQSSAEQETVIQGQPATLCGGLVDREALEKLMQGDDCDTDFICSLGICMPCSACFLLIIAHVSLFHEALCRPQGDRSSPHAETILWRHGSGNSHCISHDLPFHHSRAIEQVKPQAAQACQKAILRLKDSLETIQSSHHPGILTLPGRLIHLLHRPCSPSANLIHIPPGPISAAKRCGPS